jgi:hypothetical protein
VSGAAVIVGVTAASGAIVVTDSLGRSLDVARTALIYLAPPVLGVAAGYLFGGRLRHAAGLRLRALWLLWLAAIGQLLADHLLTGTAAAVAVAAAFGSAATCLMVNLRRDRAVALSGSVALAGAALNAVAILFNGAMPYSPTAARAAGVTADDETVKNAAANADTALASLGDVVAVPALRAVFSVGDLLIGIGIAALAAASMRRIGPPPPDVPGRNPLVAGPPPTTEPGKEVRT